MVLRIGTLVNQLVVVVATCRIFSCERAATSTETGHSGRISNAVTVNACGLLL